MLNKDQMSPLVRNLFKNNSWFLCQLKVPMMGTSLTHRFI